MPYIYIYIYMCVCVCVHMHIHIHACIIYVRTYIHQAGESILSINNSLNKVAPMIQNLCQNTHITGTLWVGFAGYHTPWIKSRFISFIFDSCVQLMHRGMISCFDTGDLHFCETCRNMPEQSRNLADAGSIGQIPALFWRVLWATGWRI